MDNATLERDAVDADSARVAPRTVAARAGHLLRGRVLPLLREHLVLVLLLIPAAAVRAAVMAAYKPAFGYFIDTRMYMLAARDMKPTTNWPFGYSLFLKPFMYLGHIIFVTMAQHGLGLLLGVGVYALLVRRGLPRKWAALAAAPVLFDARQIVLEHYILSETLFTTLLLAGVMLLLWQDRPAVWACALSGLAFSGMALTRTVGQGLIAVVVVYLLVRRVGWRRVGAFVATAALTMVVYMVGYHHFHGAYAINQVTGRYMWARVTPFVDCAKDGLTADEMKICPPEPRGKRLVNDMYLWSQDPNHIVDQYPSVQDDHIFADFAVKAIRHQPGDFALMLGRDAVHLFQPGWQAPNRIACTTDRWSMPSGDRISGQLTSACKADVLRGDFVVGTVGHAAPRITALNGALWAYGQTFVMWPLALLLMALFAVVSAAWRSRTLRPRDAADAALLSLLGLGLVAVSVTTSAVDLRYLIPLLVIVPPGAVLAWHRLRRPQP